MASSNNINNNNIPVPASSQYPSRNTAPPLPVRLVNALLAVLNEFRSEVRGFFNSRQVRQISNAPSSIAEEGPYHGNITRIFNHTIRPPASIQLDNGLVLILELPPNWPVEAKIISSEDFTNIMAKIDAWVREDPAEVNRLVFKTQVLGFLHSNEGSLKVENLQLTSLPDIFNIQPFPRMWGLELRGNQLHQLPPSIVHLENLKVLDLSDNPLEVFPSNLFRLTRIDDLNLGGCLLREIPKEIGHLQALERLKLDNNPLSSLPAEIGLLTKLTDLSLDAMPELTLLPPEIGRLTSLEYLRLCDNHLNELPPEIGQLSSLTRLYLHRSYRLSTLPAEIGRLQSLSKIELDDSPALTGLPLQILSLPENTIIYLSGCGLSLDVLERLDQLVNIPFYRGPRFSFSMPVAGEVNPGKAINVIVENLYLTAGQSPKDLSHLPQTENLRNWLYRLSDVADYKNNDLQKTFVTKILSYLELANEEELFRKTFYTLIDDATKTCGDRIALSVLHLGIAHRIATIDLQDTQALAESLIKGVWAIDLLEDIARKKIPALPLFDEIEVYLAYPIMLKAELGLQIDIQEMLYFRCSGLKPQDLEEAASYVRGQFNNEDARNSFLINQDKWKEALTLKYPAEMKVIEEEKEKRLEEASTSEDYQQIQDEYNQKLKLLTHRLLA